MSVAGKAPAKVEVYDGSGRRVGLSLVKAPGAVQVTRRGGRLHHRPAVMMDG